MHGPGVLENYERDEVMKSEEARIPSSLLSNLAS
jgi:hypothetical protein